MLIAAVIGAFALSAAVAFIAAAYRRGWRWTGLPADPGDGSPAAPPRPAKTLWDWLQLLIIPLVLALAAFALNATQDSRDRKQEDRRAARDRAIAADRAQEDTLRAYLQQMSDLITNQRLRATGRQGRSDVPTLERVLTLIALRRLNSERKSLVVQFLAESHLITRTVIYRETARGPRVDVEGDPQVTLYHADLRGVVLRDLPPSSTEYESGGEAIVAEDFSGANLQHADFRGAGVDAVSFDEADLRNADFTDAYLDGASFGGSCLSGTRFVRASVNTSDPSETKVTDFTGAEGRNVDFSAAQLNKANFEDARLTDVTLRGANTDGVRWPVGWTPTGLRTSNADIRALCKTTAQ